MQNSQTKTTFKQRFLALTYNALIKFSLPIFVVSPFVAGLYAMNKVRKWKYNNPSILHRIPFYMVAASYGFIGTFIIGIFGLGLSASIIEYIDI